LGKGFQQREIQESAYRYQKEVEAVERTVVGVNRFAAPYQKISGLLRVDPAAARKQVARLRTVREKRNATAVAAALEELEKAARGTANTMPAFIRCAEAYASVGEMCDVLTGVFGLQKEFLLF